MLKPKYKTKEHQPSIITVKHELLGVPYWEAECRYNGITLKATAKTQTRAIEKLNEQINEKTKD